jgi:hypothetical protein
MLISGLSHVKMSEESPLSWADQDGHPVRSPNLRGAALGRLAFIIVGNGPRMVLSWKDGPKVTTWHFQA